MSSDQSESSKKESPSSSYSSKRLKHGIGIWVAALFLLGAMAGAGIVAMPNAFLNAGWWAVVMVTVMSMVGCLTGLQLSWSWSILMETWPEEYEVTQTRNPYPEIAYKAGGKLWKYAVQACVHCSMFGAAIAFLILSSQNISRLLHDWFGLDINFCSMVVIISLILLPVLFLGTPKDFWPIAVGAILATALAIIFIMVGTLIDMKPCRGKVGYPAPSMTGFISAYCTICFAYGGHAAFPTIQHDMKQHARFPISVLVSFIALFIMYFPMPVLAYQVYGHTIQGTIEHNLSTQWTRDAIMVMITGHVLFAFFIVISPVAQDFERAVGIPLNFSWKRICTRTFMMSLAVFIALTLPDFNTLLELVGGTTLAATAYIFPGPFYLMLKSKKLEKPLKMSTANNGVGRKSIDDLNSSQKSLLSVIGHQSLSGKQIPVSEYLLNAVVVICGIVGAVAAVYGVFSKGAKLETPCYLSGMTLQRHITENATSCFSLRVSNFTVAKTNIDLF